MTNSAGRDASWQVDSGRVVRCGIATTTVMTCCRDDAFGSREPMYKATILGAALAMASISSHGAPAPSKGISAPLSASQTVPVRPLIAITIDDLPAHGPLPVGGDRLVIGKAIIAALAAHHAPAFGFMNAGFDSSDPKSSQVLTEWRKAGLSIGNHTFRHSNLDTVGAGAFLADVARNEPAIAAVSGGRDWHWFRYPFLAEGQSATARDAVRSELRRRGYRIAAATMGFGDYAWNDAFARCTARHDTSAIAALETSYLAAAREAAQRSRNLSQAALGRDIPYVLLIHFGAFDARMMPRLLDLYEEMGFGFTTLSKAQADPFYATATDLTVPGPTATLEETARAKQIPIPAGAPLPDAAVCA
ncbi:polysaccharide deacetylase family protein [Sphingomonas sp. MMS24-J45]|uniref:polysaccharide deacetylase family protein n=1 Tax=Sphingomonas sp. MMS24-J45 TaxID=3238806 RepID=UPI00384BB6DA